MERSTSSLSLEMIKSDSKVKNAFWNHSFFICRYNVTNVNDLKMKSYTMKSGDTLWKIATANGTTIQAIIDKNGLKSSTIQPGQTLILP
ncbi:LysM domain-containing protein [Halalkalibacter nanhaiisediminis]|uniref:LysM domain-containing protein n=1 Tax=Halalkalibacter nanhaiisediminis TaxID=688079 RepID=A0A562QPQ9_9BACI|nr:LysM domain-containing protein [Halalkalibacter nanhaiisediminis]